MASIVRIDELGGHVGEEVTVRGWLYNRRGKGKLHFLLVRDGSGIVQCVLFKGNVDEDTFAAAAHMARETALTVTGTVKADDRAPGGHEMDASGMAVVGAAVGEYPISPKEHGVDFLLSNRHLWLRSRRPWATLRIRHALINAIRDFFNGRGFLLVDAPILTPAACEGTTTLFELDYFDQGKAYLTQSGQLYGEAAAMAFGKIYTFGPTFRAEKSKTRRHLTEFWMVEPEMAYATLDDIMDLAEDFVADIVARVLDECAEEFKVLERDTAPLEKVVRPFPRMSYDEVVKFLEEKGSGIEWGGDFGAEDETVLSRSLEKPVLVHRYPRAVKAFYMKGDPADDRLALCVDMIAPEGVGEVIGGGQREDDLSRLLAQIRKHGLPQEAFEWYVDLRRYGSVPHGGFGLGVERTVGWLCGTEHVRECIPFPRMLYRIYP